MSGSIFQGAGDLIGRIRRSLASIPVAYVRKSGETKIIDATPQAKSTMGPAFRDFTLSTRSEIFVFLKKHFLDDDGNFIKPEKGDVIYKKINGITMKHEVINVPNGPCWDWNNIPESEIAIHTEKFG